MKKTALIPSDQHPTITNIVTNLVLPAVSARTETNGQCENCVTKNQCEAACLKSNALGSQGPFFRAQKVSKGEHLFYAGDALKTVYLVKTGLFKTYLNSEAGNEQIMGFQMPGEVLGADALAYQVHSLSVMALETSTVCAVPIKQLEAATHQLSPDWLIRQVYQEMLRERHVLLLTGRKHSAEARIAHFLIDMSARNKARGYSGLEFKLNMPHRDIGHYLDMALETVSRVFTRFQDKGILLVKRPYVTIIDSDKLGELAKIPKQPVKMSA